MNALRSLEITNCQTDSPALPFSFEGHQVLLAEDCVDQGHLYLKFLQAAGANVTLECNGQSAVDAVRKSLTHFDAIVIDFQMPGMDGLDATIQLREFGYRGAIIAVTAYGSEELKQSWSLAGCDAYLEKPFENTVFISVVAQQITAVHKAIQAQVA